MKKTIYLLIALILASCAPTVLKDSWKNPDHNLFQPQNILIIGITDNTTARMIYEEQLKNEFNERGLKATQSALIFEDAFKDSKQTEEDIEKKVDQLVDLGYDAILISAVKGVEEKVSYNRGLPKSYFYFRRFGRYYYTFQDYYFDETYYDKYKIYHIETLIYNIKPDTSKSLVWVTTYDIVNPRDITSTVDKYVRAVIQSLEKEQLIPIKDNLQ